MNARMSIAAALLVMSVPALAADSAWSGKTVRASYAGQMVTGKVIRSMGCLYVKFDRAQEGGVVMARIADSITSLQVRSGNRWLAQDLEAIRKAEPADCLAEANG